MEAAEEEGEAEEEGAGGGGDVGLRAGRWRGGGGAEGWCGGW